MSKREWYDDEELPSPETPWGAMLIGGLFIGFIIFRVVTGFATYATCHGVVVRGWFGQAECVAVQEGARR